VFLSLILCVFQFKLSFGNESDDKYFSNNAKSGSKSAYLGPHPSSAWSLFFLHLIDVLPLSTSLFGRLKLQSSFFLTHRKQGILPSPEGPQLGIIVNIAVILIIPFNLRTFDVIRPALIACMRNNNSLLLRALVVRRRRSRLLRVLFHKLCSFMVHSLLFEGTKIAKLNLPTLPRPTKRKTHAFLVYCRTLILEYTYQFGFDRDGCEGSEAIYFIVKKQNF
jgi:hypothetical protein